MKENNVRDKIKRGPHPPKITPENTLLPETIDVTPKWAALFPMLIEIAVTGVGQARLEAKEALMSVAHFADRTNAKAKEEEQ